MSSRLMEMPEIEREELLASRLEEMQRIQDKRNLDQMLQAQKSGADPDSVSKAAKRAAPVLYLRRRLADCLLRPTRGTRCHQGEDAQVGRAEG